LLMNELYKVLYLSKERERESVCVYNHQFSQISMLTIGKETHLECTKRRNINEFFLLFNLQHACQSLPEPSVRPVLVMNFNC